MKFYRVALFRTGQEHDGFQWFTSERDARKLVTEQHSEPTEDDQMQKDAEVEAVDVEPTKAGILLALNRYASHPDNG